MKVDTHLVADARRLCSGANVHRINTLIFGYEEAVRQVNDGKPYKGKFELWLRDLVDTLFQRQAIREVSRGLKEYSAELADRSEALNLRMDDWKRWYRD